MTNFVKCILFVIATLMFFSACGAGKKVSGQPIKPMESYNQNQPISPPSVSTVHLPIRLNSKELEILINNKLNGVIYDDPSLEGDDLKLKATKTQPIKIQMSGMTMNYRVPIQIWIFRKLFSSSITGVRGVEAEGELALFFKTQLQIKPDWTMQPQTEIVGYEWIKNMAVKTGLGNLDVKYIANHLLEKSKTTLTTAIDNAIMQSVDMPQKMNEAWSVMQNPIKVNDDYRMWCKITPQNVTMTPLRATGEALETTLSIEGVTEVAAGETTPKFMANTNLPPFKMVETPSGNDFAVNLSTDIPFAEAERMAKKFAVGQTFEPSGKKITITNIQLFGQGDKMIVNTTFTGSYNGSLYLIGKPVFDPQKNAVELQDVDYELNTKSFLLKSATWLFDKTIIKKIKESSVFALTEHLNGMKQNLNGMLRHYSLNNNVYIEGQIDDLLVQNMILTSSGIRIFIASKGKLAVNLEGLDKF